MKHFPIKHSNIKHKPFKHSNIKHKPFKHSNIKHKPFKQLNINNFLQEAFSSYTTKSAKLFNSFSDMARHKMSLSTESFTNFHSARKKIRGKNFSDQEKMEKAFWFIKCTSKAVFCKNANTNLLTQD